MSSGTATDNQKRNDTLAHLRSNSLLSDIPEDSLQTYIDQIRVLILSGGEILHEDTDTSHSVFLVAEGHISFLVRGEKNSEFVETGACESGSFFGEGATLEHLDGYPKRPLLSRARIVAKEQSTLLVVSAEVFGEILKKYPIAMATNLTRSTSKKSRRFAQEQVDNAIRSETSQVLENLLSWLSQRTLDAFSTIQLNAELLKEGSSNISPNESGAEILEACSTLDESFSALSDMAGERKISAERVPLAVEDWWLEFSPELRRLLQTRSGDLESYIRKAELETTPLRLERAFTWCFTGISLAMEPGETVKVSGGPTHGRFEFQLSFRFPMLTEFIARRLFVPFSARGNHADVCVSFSLSQQIVHSLGGTLQIEQRSGEHLVLSLSLPTYSYAKF